MNQTRKVRTDPRSTSQYSTSNRTQLPNNKVTNQTKVNNANTSKSNVNTKPTKSLLTTKSTKVNTAVKSKLDTNATRKTNNAHVVQNKSQNLQNSQSLRKVESKVNVSRNVTTKSNETKKVIENEKVNSKKINPLLDSSESKDRLKESYNESIAAEPPSISQHEVDISDPILNENHSLPEEDEYNYGSDDFESEYASDFEDASNDDSEIKSENRDEFSGNESETSEAVHLSDEPQSRHQSIEYLTKEEVTLTSVPQIRSNQLKQPVINQRLIDLSEIIKLNTVEYNVYDNAPINYDVFMQLFGRKNRRQVYIQSKYLIDEETQTDNIATAEKSSENSDVSRNSPGSASEVNPFALLSYLQKASRKVMSLIEFESDSVREGKSKLQIPNECKQFCAKFYKLSDTRFAKKATINHIYCDSQYLFAVQNMSELKGCTEKSIISLWLNCNTSSPDITLIARSHVQCLTHLNSVVIAGMIDGSIALWDLKESKHHHKQVTVEQINYVLKSSSFSTAGTALNVHQNRVVAIEKLCSSGNETNDKIASIDDAGLLAVWVIVDTFQKDVSFSENAEGMMPGGRLRLTKVWTFSFFNKKSTEFVVTMKCRDESVFIVGVDTGLVFKYSTYEPEKRVTYKPSDLELQLTPVSSICVHPSDLTFLVSYKAGYICLFSFEENSSILFFSPKNILDPIDIHWFHLNSTSFVILDSNGYVSVFNSKDQSGKEVLKYSNQSSRYTCLNPFKTRDRDCLAFGTDSGAIEVMHFNRFDTID